VVILKVFSFPMVSSRFRFFGVPEGVGGDGGVTDTIETQVYAECLSINNVRTMMMESMMTLKLGGGNPFPSRSTQGFHGNG
jgi:hypothetical protein